jgi:DNA-binding transcriptional LysR family regulator
LDIELLRAFIVVARNLSFTLAAEELGTTQPMLSRAMRRLEDLVGEELFDRRKRQIALTPSGAALLEEAQGVLDRLGLAFRRARMAGHGSPRALRVGYMSPIRTPSIHLGVRKFRSQYPGVMVDFRRMPADEQTNALRGGELDVGVMMLNNCDRRELTWRVIGREGYLAAIPSDWPVDPSLPIDLSTLRDRPFVAPDPERAPEVHAAAIACCDQAGFQPRVVRYIQDHEEARFLIAAGIGAGFAYSSALLTRLDGILYLPIAPTPKAFVESHVVWAPHRTPPEARAFIDCLESEACSAEVVQAGEGFGVVWRPMARDAEALTR